MAREKGVAKSIVKTPLNPKPTTLATQVAMKA